MLWLVEEIGELAEAVRREETDNIEEELADCFAWIGALANLYGANLEEAFLKKYPYVPYLQTEAPYLYGLSMVNLFCLWNLIFKSLIFRTWSLDLNYPGFILDYPDSILPGIFSYLLSYILRYFFIS